jgi:amidase
VLRGWEPLGNCAPLNMTGHPAISLPAASVDGMPVGAMLIGRHFDDARLVDVAARYERRFGWEGSLPNPRGGN